MRSDEICQIYVLLDLSDRKNATDVCLFQTNNCNYAMIVCMGKNAKNLIASFTRFPSQISSVKTLNKILSEFQRCSIKKPNAIAIPRDVLPKIGISEGQHAKSYYVIQKSTSSYKPTAETPFRTRSGVRGPRPRPGPAGDGCREGRRPG